MGSSLTAFPKNYPAWALFNFAVLALAGALLRYMHCFPTRGLNYQFLLHAHSHFAFSGWMFLAIILLFFYYFKSDNPQLTKHFKQLFYCTLSVSFAMLISFFVSGYGVGSIVLSTLFVLVGYWFVWLAFIAQNFTSAYTVPTILLKGAFIFGAISSLGPFGLGYIMASGFTDLAPQQNAIYFYLHFQLNGFTQLALLGFLFQAYLKTGVRLTKSANFWAEMLVYSTFSLYAIFTLWAKPNVWVWIVGFLSATLHFVAWAILLYKLKGCLKPLSFLAKTSIMAVSLQFLFQILVAFPAIGNWAFASHNLIIGYIHLLTLGSLSPLILDLFTRAGFFKPLAWLNYAFVLASVIYLSLLFGSVFLALFKISVPQLELFLLATNVAFPVFGFLYLINLLGSKQSNHLSNIKFLI